VLSFNDSEFNASHKKEIVPMTTMASSWSGNTCRKGGRGSTYEIYDLLWIGCIGIDIFTDNFLFA
jgi:hypothetical protein